MGPTLISLVTLAVGLLQIQPPFRFASGSVPNRWPKRTSRSFDARSQDAMCGLWQAKRRFRVCRSLCILLRRTRLPSYGEAR
jgi:hypothetical protein